MSDTEQHLKVLRLLQDNPDITQRLMTLQMGIRLGGLNYCLTALVQKGCVKMENFNRNPNKVKYSYLLTARGVKAKATLTAQLLKLKLTKYKALETEIEALPTEISRPHGGRNYPRKHMNTTTRRQQIPK